jgi:teichuronic acid biosynthesis glycosyltransferase TuaC
MNVFFLSSSFPRPGLPAHCPYNVSLCRALARNNQVTALVPVPWTDLSWRKSAPAIDGSSEFTVRHVRYYHVPRFGHRWHDRAMWRGVRVEAIKAARAMGRPDWMLSYWAYPDSGAALRLAREFRCPLIAKVGGSDVLLAAKHSIAWQLASKTLQAADHIITVSDDLANRICAMGIAPGRVTVMPRGVDTQRFKPGDRIQARAELNLPHDVPVLLWVGRMVPVKNLTRLLGAADHLRKHGQPFLLCLVGDGPTRAEVTKQIRTRGLERHVRVVGAATQEQLPRWYQASDVFALPSLSEGTPNVLLEALACGKPFVASRVGGIPDLAEPGVDTLVAPTNEEELAAGLAAAVAIRRDRRPPSFLDSWSGVAAIIAARAEEAVSIRYSARLAAVSA